MESRTLLNAGDFDNAFDGDGRQSVVIGSIKFNTQDVAIQVDGKVLLAGTKLATSGQVIQKGVVRLNANGTIDTTFGGGDGYVDFEGLKHINGIAVDGTDGTIVICGDVFIPGSGDFGESEFAVARLLPDGSPDLSFGGGDALVNMKFNGILEYDGEATAIMIDRQHRILAVGYRTSGLFVSDSDFAIARLTTTGALDSTFDGDGKVTMDFGNWEHASAVTIDYSGNPSTDPRYGQIIVAGNLAFDIEDNTDDDGSRFAIARFNATGQPDNSFDGDGAVTTVFAADSDSEVTGVVVQPGNRIVATGSYRFGTDSFNHNFMTARYHVNGALDGAFGPTGTGYVETDAGGFERGGDVAISYLGGLLVGGATRTTQPATAKLVIAAYTADGILDPRFSGDGISKIDVGSNADGFGAMATTGSQIAPVRKVIVAGSGGSVARVVDIGSLISIGTFQPNMYEQGSQGTSFVVARTQSLPFPETIVLTTSGTATPFGVSRDFNATGIAWGNGQNSSTEVVIPANATSADVVLTPIDDSQVEGDETMGFAVSTSLTYDASNTNSTTLVVRDNDTVGGPTVTASGFNYETAPLNATITFNQSVVTTFTIGDLVITGPTATPPAYSLDYNNVTNTGSVVFYNGLADGNYTVRVKASGVRSISGVPMAADYVFGFFVLAGDANRNRAVDIADLSILATNWQQSPRTFSQGDFSYDGKVDIADLAILATNWQTSVPAPATFRAASAFRRRPALQETFWEDSDLFASGVNA